MAIGGTDGMGGGIGALVQALGPPHAPGPGGGSRRGIRRGGGVAGDRAGGGTAAGRREGATRSFPGSLHPSRRTIGRRLS